MPGRLRSPVDPPTPLRDPHKRPPNPKDPEAECRRAESEKSSSRSGAPAYATAWYGKETRKISRVKFSGTLPLLSPLPTRSPSIQEGTRRGKKDRTDRGPDRRIPRSCRPILHHRSLPEAGGRKDQGKMLRWLRHQETPRAGVCEAPSSTPAASSRASASARRGLKVRTKDRRSSVDHR